MSNCPKCGNPVKPGEKFCMQCGYAFPAQPAPVPMGGNVSTPGSIQVPRPGQPKKKFPIVPIIILVVVVAILAVGGVLGFKWYKANSGYNKLVKQFMQSIQEEDEDTFAEIQNDYLANVFDAEKEVYDEIGVLYIPDDFDDFNEYLFEQMMEEIEDEVGEIEEFEYEIKNVKENVKAKSVYENAFEDDLEELNDEIEYYEDYYDDDDIELMEDCIATIEGLDDIFSEAKEVVKVDIKVNIKGDDGKFKGGFPIIAINQGGTWTMIPCAWEWFR